MPEADENRVLTVKEVSEYLRCHTSTVYRFVAKGEIPYFKIGSDIRFQLSAINEWIKKRSRAPALSRSRSVRKR